MKNYSKSRLTELIAVRFTGPELARLQEAATDYGVGPSTLARILINQALKPANSKARQMTSDEFYNVMETTIARIDKDKVDKFLKEISVGNPDDPTLLVWAGETQKWQEFTAIFLKALLSSLGIEVYLSENEELLKDTDQSPSPLPRENEVEPRLN